MNLNATLLGEMVTFAIFVWFTMRFVIPPIQKVVEQRQLSAQETEQNLAKSKSKLESDSKKGEAIITGANTEAKAITKAAKTDARNIVAQAESDAKARAAKVAADNDKKLEQLYSHTMSELKSKFATDVIAAGVEAVLKKNMTPDLNAKIIDDVIIEEM